MRDGNAVICFVCFFFLYEFDLETIVSMVEPDPLYGFGFRRSQNLSRLCQKSGYGPDYPHDKGYHPWSEIVLRQKRLCWTRPPDERDFEYPTG